MTNVPTDTLRGNATHVLSAKEEKEEQNPVFVELCWFIFSFLHQTEQQDINVDSEVSSEKNSSSKEIFNWEFTHKNDFRQ